MAHYLDATYLTHVMHNTKGPTMKTRHAAALALLGLYRFVPGKIDLEIIILTVVSVFVLFGVAAWFSTW